MAKVESAIRPLDPEQADIVGRALMESFNKQNHQSLTAFSASVAMIPKGSPQNACKGMGNSFDFLCFDHARHSDSILPTNSRGIQLKADPIYTIKFDRVKLSIWWSTKILELIRKFIAIAFITCFVWTLWNLPQANSYPDRTCPALSYQILGKQNTTIRCQPCSDCPPGRQLTPPCGSKIQQNAVIACTVCPSNAYKDSQGRGICLPCQKCSPKQTISPCLAWKNARCGPCPRGTYPWNKTENVCKKCFKCCGTKRLATLECINLGQCLRTNCTLEIKTKGSDPQMLILYPPRLNTPKRKTPSNSGPIQNVRSSNTSENPSKSAFNVQEMLKRTRVTREVQQALERSGNEMATEQTPSLPSISRTAVANAKHSNESFGTTSKEMNVTETKLQTASNYFGINFTTLVKTLTVLVAILILALISVSVMIACFCCKRQSRCEVICCIKINPTSAEEYKSLLGDNTYQTGLYQGVTLNRGNLEGTLSKEYTTTSDLESVRLSDISPDLEDIIVKTLEVTCSGQYGWKKVGKVLGVNQDNLNYWENLKSMEKPATGQLLETIKATHPEFTIIDLMDTLRSPEVQLPEVALRIHQHLRSARR